MSYRLQQSLSERRCVTRNLPSKRSEPTPPFSFSTTIHRYGETDCDFVDRRRRVTMHLEGVRYYGYRYYNPDLGRWISRDPIEDILDSEVLFFVRDGNIENLYRFIDNSSICEIDWSGLYTLNDAVDVVCPNCQNIRSGRARTRCYEKCRLQKSKDVFDEWLTLERSRGDWWKSLPKCPKKLCISTELTHRGTRERIQNPDTLLWENPNRGGLVLARFHPGAVYEMRTRGTWVSGNQCTYDADGNVITDVNPPAAGSADWFSPNASFHDHQLHDVQTYELAERLGRVREYYSVRPVWTE